MVSSAPATTGPKLAAGDAALAVAPPAALDPARPIDWSTVLLPDAWPDRLPSRDLAVVLHGLWRLVSRKHHPVRLPDDLPGRDQLPAYLLQEFHHLPNGNFSKSVTHSYSIGFDRVMLGTLVEARAAMAARLGPVKRVLDIGTGSGGVVTALRNAGIPDVWALEPSPYLLAEAARQHPGVRFIQGVVETTGLPTQHFGGATACFVFHEIPPDSANRGLAELRRVLVPGARLVIVEPSPLQLRLGWWTLLRRYGWRGWYFRLLARRVHEPFLEGWHSRPYAAWFAEHDFQLEEDIDQMPWRMFVARAR
jgi:ubiquinone/menaquinone biosynthesis C-methylase UbiE